MRFQKYLLLSQDLMEIYDLKALTTLYLLDSDKIVLLKDRSIEEIYRCLESI